MTDENTIIFVNNIFSDDESEGISSMWLLDKNNNRYFFDPTYEISNEIIIADGKYHVSDFCDLKYGDSLTNILQAFGTLHSDAFLYEKNYFISYRLVDGSSMYLAFSKDALIELCLVDTNEKKFVRSIKTED